MTSWHLRGQLLALHTPFGSELLLDDSIELANLPKTTTVLPSLGIF